VAWVQEQNYGHGVAPSSADMATKFVDVAGVAAGPVGTSDREGRRFCQKFRRRWRLRLGSRQVQDPISEDAMRSKACFGKKQSPHV
jgi:hypothetical protein